MDEILFYLLESLDKSATEKTFEGNIQVHERLLRRFIKYDTTHEDEETPEVRDTIIKYAGAVGYSQQIHTGLVKVYSHEKRLKDVENKLARLPPEIKEKLIDSGN